MRLLKYRKNDRPRVVNRKRHADNAMRLRIHVSKGDDVQVVRGEHKGSTGKILRVYLKTGRVVVQGVNMVKKHRRARRPEEQSGIIEMEAPIHSSNVMLIDPKSGGPTRTRRRIDTDGTKERISAKNGLENYVYGVRNSLNEEKFKDAFSSSDRTTVEKLVTDTQKWLDSNEHAEKHEYEAKQKEVESVCMPLMQKAYKSAGGGGNSGSGHPEGQEQQRSGSGPTVDEVD